MLNKFIASSADPNKISLTLKSFVPFILAIAAIFNVDLPETSIDEVISAVVAIVSGLGVLYGAWRKVAVWWKSRA